MPLLYRLLGDAAFLDSNAHFMAEMVGHRRWLHSYLRVTVDSNYVAWRRLDRLYRLRRQLGRLLYTHHLYSNGSFADAPEAYRDVMMEACLVDYPPEYCGIDWDWLYTSMALWRGWRLATSLWEVLSQSIATDWFRAPESGPWLRQYWQNALQEQPEQLQEKLLGTATESALFLEALLGDGHG
jgi:hypothetical protein